MAKVLNIVQDSEFYYNLALEQIANENYFPAIKNLITAINIKRKEKYLIELAELYYVVGGHNASSAIYLKLLTEQGSADFIFALVRNMVESGEIDDGAEFAFRTFMSLSNKSMQRRIDRLAFISENESLQGIFGTPEIKINQPFLVNKAEINEQRLLQHAFRLLEKQNFDGAIAEIQKIPTSSDNFLKIQEILAVASIANGDRQLAISIAKTIRQIEPYNLTAFRAFYEYKVSPIDGQEYDETSLCQEIITQVTNTGDAVLIKTLGELFYHYGNYSYLYQCMIADYRYNNCSNDTLFRLAIACYILGNEKEGSGYINRLNILYPNDYKAKLLSWLSHKDYDKSVWEKVFLVFPENIVPQLTVDFLTDFYDKSGGKVSPNGRVLLELLMYSEDVESYYPLVYDAMDIDPQGVKEFLQSVLIDNDMSYDTRLDVVRLFLENNTNKSVFMLMDDRVMPFRIKSMRSLPSKDKNFAVAYGNVFENLLYLGYTPSPLHLDTIITKMLKIDSKFKKANILSAVVHYYYAKMNEIDTDIADLASLYNSNQHSVKKYLDIYKIDL